MCGVYNPWLDIHSCAGIMWILWRKEKHDGVPVDKTRFIPVTFMYGIYPVHFGHSQYLVGS